MSAPSASAALPLRDDFVAGIDIGGTKIHIADTLHASIRRYETSDYVSVEALLEDYFARVGARPKRVVLVVAGPRNDETGDIRLTNCSWPPFVPAAAARTYPGTTFVTANDMIGATAGMLAQSSMNETQLKYGTPASTGTKLAVTVSTGIGVAAATWDEPTQRYVFLATEGGHIGFQPRNPQEQSYLDHLHQKYPQASAELALAGKHGVQNLVDHFLDASSAPALHHAVVEAQAKQRPVGAVLLEFATDGDGQDQVAARTILSHMGALLGSYLGDLALAFKATGGIYLTGSVALGLAEYWAEQTDFTDRFNKTGGVHADWLANVPIYLATDPNVGVAGALALAKEA
jgi:glucokinase